ncbi:FAD-dependent oxidoreductase [bacterium]|nr:FAD-dependent oxidoreductase [bacterium]
MQRVFEQAKSYRPDIILGEVKQIKKGSPFLLQLGSGQKIKADFVLLASGSKRRRLGLPKEKKLVGKGVHYCAICDGYFYRHKTVGVVGGGDAGATSALLLSELAKRVYLLEREEKLLASPFWQEKLKKKKNVLLILKNEIEALLGRERLEGIRLKRPYQGKKELAVEGLFVEIGSIPRTRLARQLGVELDERGFIKVKKDQSTSVPRVYAAGDNCSGSNYFKQLITAGSEGAIAVNSIYKALAEKTQ